MNRSILVGLALSLSCLTQAYAQPMQQMTEQGISFISGGVGIGERDALQAAAKHYNLKLVFAEKGSGAYLADVKVTIEGGPGAKHLNAESQGPWFLAKLPPGRYEITAKAGGKRLVKSVTIGNKGRAKLHFYWPKP